MVEKSLLLLVLWYAPDLEIDVESHLPAEKQSNLVFLIDRVLEVFQFSQPSMKVGQFFRKVFLYFFSTYRVTRKGCDFNDDWKALIMSYLNKLSSQRSKYYCTYWDHHARY